MAESGFMGDLFKYVRAVGWRWLYGVVPALLGLFDLLGLLVDGWKLDPPVTWVYASLLVALFFAGFLTWREENRNTAEFDPEFCRFLSRSREEARNFLPGTDYSATGSRVLTISPSKEELLQWEAVVFHGCASHHQDAADHFGLSHHVADATGEKWIRNKIQRLDEVFDLHCTKS